MKIVLAYSGGLDTSVLLSWLKETYDAEMIAFCANIGQEEELRGLEAKAKKTGASKIYIDDLQEEFARDFIYPDDPGRRDLRRPVFPRHQHRPAAHRQGHVGVAKKEKADAIAHGATGKGNDQVRFELTAATLAPDLQVIAPWRDARYRSEFPGRQEMIAYCARHKIPVQASAKKPFSMRPEPAAHFLRGGHSRRPVDGRERQKVSRLVHHAVRVSRRRAEQTGIRDARFRERQLRGGERQETFIRSA